MGKMLDVHVSSAKIGDSFIQMMSFCICIAKALKGVVGIRLVIMKTCSQLMKSLWRFMIGLQIKWRIRAFSIKWPTR